MVWKPNVTVAAVIEQNGKYLLVEEEADSDQSFNQPTGHWEPDESIIEGVIRETLEETGYTFVPQSLLGIYRWHSRAKDVIYLRFAFTGLVAGHDPARMLDMGILRAEWFGVDEIRGLISRHRIPLVMQCIEDHLAGKHYPLDIFSHFDSNDDKP
jgi:8-oxo-dGTP pyrophosphatase MutT (NUDIX family)